MPVNKIVLRAPIQRVFETVARPDWWAGRHGCSVSGVTGRPGHVGERFTEVTRDLKGEGWVSTVFEVTGFRAPYYWKFETHDLYGSGGGVHATVIYMFAEVPEGTEWERVMDFTFHTSEAAAKYGRLTSNGEAFSKYLRDSREALEAGRGSLCGD